MVPKRGGRAPGQVLACSPGKHLWYMNSAQPGRWSHFRLRCLQHPCDQVLHIKKWAVFKNGMFSHLTQNWSLSDGQTWTLWVHFQEAQLDPRAASVLAPPQMPRCSHTLCSCGWHRPAGPSRQDISEAQRTGSVGDRVVHRAAEKLTLSTITEGNEGLAPLCLGVGQERTYQTQQKKRDVPAASSSTWHFSKLSSLPLSAVPAIYHPEIGKKHSSCFPQEPRAGPVSLNSGYKDLGGTSLKLAFLLSGPFPSSNCIKFHTKSKAWDCHVPENISLSDILTDLEYFYSNSDWNLLSEWIFY